MKKLHFENHSPIHKELEDLILKVARENQIENAHQVRIAIDEDDVVVEFDETEDEKELEDVSYYLFMKGKDGASNAISKKDLPITLEELVDELTDDGYDIDSVYFPAGDGGPVSKETVEKDDVVEAEVTIIDIDFFSLQESVPGWLSKDKETFYITEETLKGLDEYTVGETK